MQELNISLVDMIGFAAAVLVFLTFCMRAFLPLRLIAITSNICFVIYGLTADLAPILILHLLLLPINVLRTTEQLQTRRRMRTALREEPNLNTLLPFMVRQDVGDGEYIMRRGEMADRFYVIADGKVSIDDVGKVLGKGDIFGEIGFFSTDGKRTASARALGPVNLTWIDRDTIMRLCHDNPEFSLFLTRLMVTRLIQNYDLQATQKMQSGVG